MNAIEQMKMIGKVIAALRSFLPLLIAGLLGGLISGGIVKCSTRPSPVTIEVINRYEKELQKNSHQIDSARSAPVISVPDAVRILSERYAD